MLLVAPLSKAGPHDNHTFQAPDHNEIKDWWVGQGGSIDSYLYSENSTTGSDGVLGNEHICIRDDVNKVYVGRSDVCVNRSMDSTYSYIQIDEIDWATQEYIVGQTGDLIGDTSQYWDGCYTVNQGWGGTSGGSCPTINDQYVGAADGQINFGYVERTLTNLAAINIALEQAGIEATGYNYSWSIKNNDAEYKDSGNGRNTPDTFYVEVVIRDTQGNAVFSKTYDYSQYYSSWTPVTGEETFADPFDVSTLESIQLNVTGKDLGYWAGYYGPEFKDPSIKLNYRYAGNPVAEESLEDTVLLSAQCSADPTFSPECPGYNDAFMANINTGAPTIDDVTTGMLDPITDTASTGGFSNDPMDTTNNGLVGMASSSPAPGSNVQETQAATSDTATESVAESTGETSTGAGRSLNANELNALSAAEDVASAATSIAAESSTQSLTSSNTGTSTGAPGTTGGFDTNGVAGASNFGGGFGGSSFGSDSTNSGMDSNMGNTGMDSNSGDSASMDLAMGGSVQTEDITGESALSASEQLTQGADMADIELASLDLDLIRDIVNSVAERTLQDIKDEQEDSMEEANEASIAQANAEEDRLAQAAMAGSTDESALVALLGYNPDFRAYQQPQMADGDLYPPKDIYTDKKNYDNPAARFFNGASDAKHKSMVRSQYR